ncbi:hypothetical protein RRG08_023420 [Elysia crispata]|uniref:EGF-like domain-containing protein n=1 Tax=Elysia crispata TaxID=231223 RepID=A0AAE1CXR3_9GAST|nr:hypothetical protein RRG08_023420 [Elysia crispata]
MCSCLGGVLVNQESNTNIEKTDCTLWRLVAPDESVETPPPECENHGKLVDGLCMCPGGFTGQRCQLQNPDICLDNYENVFLNSETFDISKLRPTKDFVRFVKPGRSPSRPYIASIAVRSPARALPVPAADIASIAVRSPARALPVQAADIASIAVRSPARALPVQAADIAPIAVRSPARALPVPAADIASIAVRSPARALPVQAADIKSIAVRSPAQAVPVPAVHHVYCGEITSPGAPRPGRGYQVYYGEITSPGAPRPGRTSRLLR